MGHGPVSSAACGLTAVRELLSSFHLLDSRRTRVMQSASLIRLKQKGTLKQSAERTTNKGKDEMETGGGGGGGGCLSPGNTAKKPLQKLLVASAPLLRRK